jgi:DNA-binding response OmpR family regulator
MAQREVRRLPRRVLLLDEDPRLESEAERVLRAEGFEVLTARDGAEALRKAAHLPVDLILLSATAQERQTGLFLESFASLPRARPVPILLAGPSRPAWALSDSQLCARPYVAEELLLRVRNTLALEAEAPRPSTANTVDLKAEVRASL